MGDDLAMSAGKRLVLFFILFDNKIRVSGQKNFSFVFPQ
jgi:hypothetical protein